MSSIFLGSESSLSSGMSVSERHYFTQVREMLQAAMRGDVPFSIAMGSLLSDLRVIRANDWDVAALGGSGSPSAVEWSIKSNATTQRREPSAAQRQLLDDLDGLIDHSVKNGISFLSAASVLAHDTSGLGNYGWDLQKANADFFLPKSAGWGQRNREPIGEVAERSE